MPTSFLRPLPLRLPIVQGPMTGSDSPALTAAVSGAGGLGMIGAGSYSPAAIADAAAQVRRSTDQPFGINLFVQDTPTPTPPPWRAHWSAWRRCTPNSACNRRCPHAGAKISVRSSRPCWPRGRP